MRIYNFGYASYGPTLLKKKGRCEICGCLLEEWYSNVIEQISNYLPPSFKHLCCHCAFLSALHLPLLCSKCKKAFLVLTNDNGSTTVTCGCDLKHVGNPGKVLKRYREGL